MYQDDGKSFPISVMIQYIIITANFRSSPTGWGSNPLKGKKDIRIF